MSLTLNSAIPDDQRDTSTPGQPTTQKNSFSGTSLGIRNANNYSLAEKIMTGETDPRRITQRLGGR